MSRIATLWTLVAVLLVTACAPTPAVPVATTAPTPAAPQPATQAPPPPATKPAPVEINYMMWGSPDELAVWQKIVDDFHAAYPYITVKVDVADWDGYWEKLKTLYAGNTPPDVFAMDAPLYPDWAARGVLLNLQPYIDATPGLLDGLYPGTLTAYKRADGYYGLPRDFQTIVLFYNKDMFDAAKVAYPTGTWTYDDLRKAAKELTRDTNGDGKIDQWGFSPDLWDMELFWSEAIWGYGGEVIDTAAGKTLLAEGKARDAWHFIAQMVTEDKSIPDPDTATQFGGDPFAAGVSAMTTIGHWVVPEYAKLEFKWAVAPFPAGPAGRATSVNSAGFVVAKASQHPAEAWEFVKFAIGAGGQTRLAELGFALPVLKSVAEGPAYLEQKSAPIDHKVFLDALAYAHAKPTFKGYDAWATAVGDGLIAAWTGEKPIDTVLDEIVPAADEVLAQNK